VCLEGAFLLLPLAALVPLRSHGGGVVQSGIKRLAPKGGELLRTFRHHLLGCGRSADFWIVYETLKFKSLDAIATRAIVF
jgi:hypothetical protein